MLGILDAIAGARHSDPFSVLGPHMERGRLTIRACLPAAEAVSVTQNGAPPVVMTKSHPAGVYEATLPDAPKAGEGIDYRLRVTYPGGYVAEVDDPYRYGRVITDYDLYLFGEGNHTRIHDKLGAHPMTIGSTEGVHFAVWAPNATRASVVGDFNDWDGRVHPMRLLGVSGVWEIFIPAGRLGHRYKFELRTRTGEILIKADPFGFQFEVPPLSASIVSQPAHAWGDAGWMDRRADAGSWFDRPMAIYEVHLGSWARVPDEGEGRGDRYLTYRELAERLIPYVKEMGYTHIELLPVMEHPFGFVGLSGHGLLCADQPLRHAVGLQGVRRRLPSTRHRRHPRLGAGPLPEGRPSGCAQFDGTALFEHADPRQGEHRDWGTLIFNYGRTEVRNFLLANALFWLEEFHVDGLRVDAVASMLYLDYSRNHGEWIPNRFGGRENLDAIDFMRDLNTQTHAGPPDRSRSPRSRPRGRRSAGRRGWAGWVSPQVEHGMDARHPDEYVKKDPVYRRWEHQHLTFSMLYAFNENFILPFSHDEVVHGKGSMFGKVPGDAWQKAATLRVLYTFMYAHPGKKLLFMGDEFGQGASGITIASLDWNLLNEPLHAGLQRFVRDLNRVYAAEPALHEVDFDARLPVDRLQR